ncbi:hypothetical protein PF005_g31002, partial [Phytophthora fragariae]
MGGVSIHSVASATNIEAASWAYTSSASNASYDFKIVTVASVSATSGDSVSLFGVANATNIETSPASESSDYYHIVAVAANISAVLLASSRQWA